MNQPLPDIPVRIDLSPGADDASTGMAQALLREVAAHLRSVAAGGERQILELGNLPLSEGDRQQLDEWLGKGEVEVTIQAAGLTRIHETRYPGVWWVKYFKEGGNEVVAEQLEIGAVPTILEAHIEDIQDSAERLPQLFETISSSNPQ